MSSSKLEALQRRLGERLAAGAFYEAEQIGRVAFSRAVAQKRFDEACSIVEHTVSALAEHQQWEAAAQLARQLVTSHPQADVQLVVRLARLLQPASAVQLLQIALRSHERPGAGADGPAEGAVSLHAELAQLYCTALKDFGHAQPHLARAGDAALFAQQLNAYVDTLPQEDRPLAQLRAVLHCLCAHRLPDAEQLCAALCAGHTAALAPALSLADMLVTAVRRGLPAALLGVLRDKYAPLLLRDTALGSMLDRVGELYFGQPARGGLMQAILGQAS